MDLYNKHCLSPGLSILPKLRYEHIKLNSYSKMRVDLAAQVIIMIYLHIRLGTK